MNDNGIKQDIFECKLYITDLETNKNSKEISITDLIFDDDLEFEFGNYEDEDYSQLPYKDFKFFINDYSVTFYSPQYHKLKSNWNSLRECIYNHIDGAREELNIIMQDDNLEYINKCSLQFEAIRKNLEIVLDKMNELEGVDNENN